MSIWFGDMPIGELNRLAENTLASHLGIEVTEAGDDYLQARMPVNANTHQPMGVLHGGASVALAETVGSIASVCCLEPGVEYAVGQEINANHLRPVSTGWVYAKASPIHIGKRSHVWRIQIKDEAGRPVCESRITMAVLAYNG